LNEIERAAAQAFVPLGLISQHDADEGVVSEVEHAAAIAAGLNLVAETQGALIGYAMGHAESGEVYLHQIDVDPAHQGRGAGRALLEAFWAAARAAGASAVVLSTFRDIPWNAPFYARGGFSEVPHAEYAPWMKALEAEQAQFLDVTKRVFMRRAI